MSEWEISPSLDVRPAPERLDLLAGPVAESVLMSDSPERVGVAEIDPGFADTAVFCARYGVPPAASANCVITTGRRSGERRRAACLVLATGKVDVNGAVRRRLDVRKASFAPQEETVHETGMAYGGITPFGLPSEWPVLLDEAVANSPAVVVGSGLRSGKIVVAGEVLAELANAEVLAGLDSTTEG
ncbi:prolyl-tRNA editing enzyme YbaK/EbsC (Cys-tRNA(Pro) deacylase) [Actinopolyspora biskrensis]|uniref:Prolyl-tRNA editing enzyme YbaK/EbsC (Cys-tRNA(Pro) deacylase) n=1 Tax=Actinopolyspora biskrensis TaxID=1470178 RepID=A0A852YU81_9ACTN|nr:YbaK/EbsC family protein [Actinopolyspora biskrensis]NYH78724.1 prolyl-tRNA editing enzyme YbaK/EbsC (Cys-tRNA(Pro) deacylase) [Actinopolyspora biskrensis]